MTIMPAAKEFFRDWARMLYWVFFKPSGFRTHLREIAPELPEFQPPSEGRRGRLSRKEFWESIRANPALRSLLWRALFALVASLLIFELIYGSLISATYGQFNWTKIFIGVADGVAAGVILGVWGSVIGGVAGGFALGVASGLAFGVWGGTIGNVTIKEMVGWEFLFFSLWISWLSVMIWGAVFGVAAGVTAGITASLSFGWLFGLGWGMKIGVVVVIATGMVSLRLPIYLFEIVPTLLLYRRNLSEKKAAQLLRKSPVYFDELLILPQPFLSSLLLIIARADLKNGLKHIAHIAVNPFQRWASQRCLRTILERDAVSIFIILNHLLRSPEPYQVAGYDHETIMNIDDTYFSTKLLFAEIADQHVIPENPARRTGEGWARKLTIWLRTLGESPYASLASAYLDLLFGEDSLKNVLVTLEYYRGKSFGDEFFQTFRLLNCARDCHVTTQIARMRSEFNSLDAISDPLRPEILAILRQLKDVSVDATAFLSSEHPISRRDALLKAQSVLEDARQSSESIYQPEQRLFLDVIEQWKRILVEEGGQVAERVEVEVLPNPYIAGRPIKPEDGKLFVGRRSVFKEIEGHLQNGMSIVLHGQRRIGKTSILQHLPKRLPHNILTIFINLQRAPASSTSGFFNWLAQEMIDQTREAGRPAPELPMTEDFSAEPFLTFERFLKQVERSLQGNQRVLMVFDEFEEMENSVKKGSIDREIFSFLRGVTQTGRGFTLIFAGLHTLEQMTYEYWNPFFNSVQRVKVNYLPATEARGLIIDPVDQFPLAFEDAAIERIIEATGGQPYLLQNLCHNLVGYLNEPLTRSNRATLEDVNAVLERTLESGTYYFDDYVWGWSSEAERIVLAAVAESVREGMQGWVEFESIERHLPQKEAIDALKSLCARDVLEEGVTEERKLAYRFQVELSRLWVAKMHPLPRILIEYGGS